MPQLALPIWHGSLEDARQLEVAIQRNCDCTEQKRRCSAHEALLQQRFVDGILFARWMRARLIKGEECR